MIIGIALLLVCIGALVVVWVRLAGIEVSGGFFEGLDYILSGALTIRFQILLSLAVLTVGVGAGIFTYELRHCKFVREFGAAMCVAIALASGFFSVTYLV